MNRLLWEAGDRLAHPVGLSRACWQVLGVVEHQPIPVAHVARIIGLTRQSVQQTADVLASDGFIIYTNNLYHCRAKLMTITPKGRKALNYVQQYQIDWADQVSETLSLEASETAVTVWQQLTERLESHETDELDE